MQHVTPLQVLRLEHDPLLPQLLNDGGVGDRHEQHPQPGHGPAQCEVEMFLEILQTLQ